MEWMKRYREKNRKNIYLGILFAPHWPMSQCWPHAPARWRTASIQTAIVRWQTRIRLWIVVAANHQSSSAPTCTNNSFVNIVSPHRPIPCRGIPNFSSRNRYSYKLYDTNTHSNGISLANIVWAQSIEINLDSLCGVRCDPWTPKIDRFSPNETIAISN